MTATRLDALVDTIERDHPRQPAEQLIAAVLDAARLTDIADHLVGHFVDAARRSGLSWAEIGECLGVTKQAAQKRFVVKDDLTLLTAFTAKARQVVLHAERHAADRRDATVEPAHLLLGILDVPDCLAARELLTSKDESGVRAIADELLGSSETGRTVSSPPTLSEATTHVLESASGYAVRIGHDWIGTEHVLLALLHKSTPGRLARRLGVNATETEGRLVQAANALATGRS